jgi:hypothetical protein
MKYPALILSFFLGLTIAGAQSPKKDYNKYVQEKNFHLLTLLQRDTTVCALLQNDPVLAKLAVSQNDAIKRSLENCKDYLCITTVLKIDSAQVELIGKRLAVLYLQNAALRRLVKDKMIPSGAYSMYDTLAPASQFIRAWQQDTEDIDSTIAVYAEGKSPNYPDIDSISFNVHDPSYIKIVQQVTQQVYNETSNSRLFFLPSMTAALAFLNVNGRNEAGNYEPMETGVNKLALEKEKAVTWSNYKYTVLMVPGEGPDSSNTPISPGSIARCKLAAAAFQERLAPFIMVSGGNVHPYKTKYCEADEMKKYLVQNLRIPDSVIFMEPHARHTTTNMRNSVRLLMQYNFPLKQAALVVSDASQIGSIVGMRQRCIDELGYVPYQLGNQVSATSLEFYVVPEAPQVNPTEPLDP